VAEVPAGECHGSCTAWFMIPMTDERAQLVEDIHRSATMRANIVEQARLDKKFDIAAAWEDLGELDKSLDRRIIEIRTRGNDG
jgi:hypothetical protein